MTTYTCPNGHSSAAADYCDVCGEPIGGAQPAVVTAPPADASTAPPRACPNCGNASPAGALFCEACGYDFTTGQLPRADPAPSTLDLSAPPVVAAPLAPADPLDPGWVVEVWVDPDWYAAQQVTDPIPSPGMPHVIPLRERSLLVGRTSASRNIHPQIDVSSDSGVSRRHAQLTTDGQRWWVEDLQSANGTFVGEAGRSLPATPIAVGQRVELDQDARIYLGAWTRLVVRPANPDELS
jgi:hypothetical protein